MTYFNIALVFALIQIGFVLCLTINTRNKLKLSDIPIFILFIIIISFMSIFWPLTVGATIGMMYAYQKQKQK